MKSERVIYYSDPLEDDFSPLPIRTREVAQGFPFLRRSFLWNLAAALLYYCIAVPIVFLISKVYLGLRFENRQVLQQLSNTGYFLYGNHTRMLDAFLPAMTAFPKKAYVVANPDAVSLPFLKNLVLMLGVIPIPTRLSGMRDFLSTIQQRGQAGDCVAIFPEAHIWPFYTGIRPFPDTAFRYPVQQDLPVVAMVTTYRRRRGLLRWVKKPAMTVTISQPMYPRTDLSPSRAREELRDRVHDFMVEVSSTHENVAYIRYAPAQEK